MNHRRVAAAVICLAGIMIAAGAASVAGTWEGTSNDGQEDHPFTLTLRQDAGAWKGDIMVNGEEVSLDNLKVDGQSISWDTTISGDTYKCEGTISGDTMSGTFSSDARSGTWKATRKPSENSK